MSTHTMYHEKENAKTAAPARQQTKSSPEKHKINLADMADELTWLKKIIKARLETYQEDMEDEDCKTITEIAPLPELGESSYHELIRRYEFGAAERLLIILTFAVIHKPAYFRPLLRAALTYGQEEFGGMINQAQTRYLPTLGTALFLLSGQHFAQAASYRSRFTREHPLFKEQILLQEEADRQLFSGGSADPLLELDPSYAAYLATGTTPRLDHGKDFPAELLETEKEFADLVLKEHTRKELFSIIHFITHYQSFYGAADTVRKLNRGYVVLFHGTPGTGKSMTAALLGKECGLPVYRVNLSKVISKYIGETEKNLERIFTRLEGRQVLLFFDEADALFGKRTEIVDARDRYANQEISYLLQRIEQWNGVVILATNYHQNLDDAFQRRIAQKILFTTPDTLEGRSALWHNHLPEQFRYESEALVEKLCRGYDLSGAMIGLILKRACIAAMSQETEIINGAILNPLLREICNEDRMQQFRPV